MRILTYKEESREKLGLVVDCHIYDLESVCASTREVKVISRPMF